MWKSEVKCLFKRNQNLTIEEATLYYNKENIPWKLYLVYIAQILSLPLCFLGRAIQRLILAKTIHSEGGWFSYSGLAPAWLHLVSHTLTRGLAFSNRGKKKECSTNFNSMEWSLFLIIHYLASLNIWLANGSSEILTGYFSQFKIILKVKRKLPQLNICGFASGALLFSHKIMFYHKFVC